MSKPIHILGIAGSLMFPINQPEVMIGNAAKRDRAVNTKMYIACGLLTIVVLAGSAASLSAAGFRLPDQDAFATARGKHLPQLPITLRRFIITLQESAISRDGTSVAGFTASISP